MSKRVLEVFTDVKLKSNRRVAVEIGNPWVTDIGPPCAPGRHALADAAGYVIEEVPVGGGAHGGTLGDPPAEVGGGVDLEGSDAYDTLEARATGEPVMADEVEPSRHRGALLEGGECVSPSSRTCPVRGGTSGPSYIAAPSRVRSR